jgi:hypothetical protein
MIASLSRIAVVLMAGLLVTACNDRSLGTPNGIMVGQGEDPPAVPGDDPTDVDTDGVPNEEDNCPVTFNPGQEDADGDGVGDACDDCPTVSDPEQGDQDENNVGDACQNMPLCPNGDDLCR